MCQSSRSTQRPSSSSFFFFFGAGRARSHGGQPLGTRRGGLGHWWWELVEMVVVLLLVEESVVLLLEECVVLLLLLEEFVLLLQLLVGGGRRGVHQVVLLVLVEEEEEEEEIYPNCHIFCWIQLTAIILKTWPPFHTCPPHWTASPWKLWTYAWTELLQLVFLLEKLELMVSSSARLPYFKGLILSYSKNKVFHVILLFWGIFSNILMLAGIEFCFRWSPGTQLVIVSLE